MNQLIHLEKRGRVTVGWAKGANHRLYEDRYRILTKDVPVVGSSDRGEVFAVLDGMGGLSKGMQAAQEIADCLISYFEDSEGLPDGPVGMGCLLDEVSEDLAHKNWNSAEENDESTFRLAYGAAGTICLLNQGALHVFHAGDTEGWIHQNGKWSQLTLDEGDGQELANFFGLPFERGFEVKTDTRRVSEGDRVVLFSDGIPKGVTRDRALEATLAVDLESSLAKLLSDCHPRSGDDLTLMVAKV